MCGLCQPSWESDKPNCIFSLTIEKRVFFVFRHHYTIYQPNSNNISSLFKTLPKRESGRDISMTEASGVKRMKPGSQGFEVLLGQTRHWRHRSSSSRNRLRSYFLRYLRHLWSWDQRVAPRQGSVWSISAWFSLIRVGFSEKGTIFIGFGFVFWFFELMLDFFRLWRIMGWGRK